MDSEFSNQYRKVLENTAASLGTSEAAVYALHIDKAINSAIEKLQSEAERLSNCSVDVMKGFLAEQWHAGTFNIDATARGKDDVWAYVPGDNKTGQDVIFGDSNSSFVAEVKYYKSGEDTTKAISRPEYSGNDKVVPADQLDSVREHAEKLTIRNQDSRPEQSANYKDTASNADNKIVLDDTSSKPIGEKDAKQMAKDFKDNGEVDPNKYGLNSESFVLWSDILRQSGEAALHAAILSAALSAAPHIWAVFQEYIEAGKIDSKNLHNIGKDILTKSGSSGLRASIAAGLTAACKTGLMGKSLKSISPIAIGMATAITINTIENSIKLYRGEMTRQEFAYVSMRDTFVLASGMSGAALGQIIIPIPLLGALVGNIVGSTIGIAAFGQTHEFLMGICIESGWTFFGIVDQDYTLSDEVLINAGHELFSCGSFQVQSFSVKSFSTNSFSVNSLSFTPVRRGLIRCGVVGYH